MSEESMDTDLEFIYYGKAVQDLGDHERVFNRAAGILSRESFQQGGRKFDHGRGFNRGTRKFDHFEKKDLDSRFGFSSWSH
jgi:hypothetical protein